MATDPEIIDFGGLDGPRGRPGPIKTPLNQIKIPFKPIKTPINDSNPIKTPLNPYYNPIKTPINDSNPIETPLNPYSNRIKTLLKQLQNHIKTRCS